MQAQAIEEQVVRSRKTVPPSSDEMFWEPKADAILIFLRQHPGGVTSKQCRPVISRITGRRSVADLTVNVLSYLDIKGRAYFSGGLWFASTWPISAE